MDQNELALVNAIMDEMCPIHTMYRDAEYLLPSMFLEAESYHILSIRATAIYDDGTLTFVHYNLNDVSDRERVICATPVTSAEQYLDAVQKFFGQYPEEVTTIFYQ